MTRPILLTTPVLAWPPDQGSRRFLLESARSLQTLGPVTWLTRSLGPQSEARERLRDEGFDLRLDESFVGRSAIDRLRRRVAIDLRAAWRRVPREEEFVCPPSLLQLARGWWAEHPDGLGVAAYWSAARSLECAPRGQRVLLAADVESQCMEFGRQCGAPAASARRRDQLRAAESRAFLRADLVALLTEEDRLAATEIVADAAGGAPEFAIWPTVMPSFEADAARSAASERGPGEFRLLVYGHWEAGFNRDGLRWFLDDVWSGLSERLPSATLRVVGRGAESFGTAPRTTLVGYVDDLSAEIASADVVLIPLRFAGGMRYRLLEALAHGSAVVATPMAARGSLARPGEHYLQASSVEEWTQALTRLQSDAARRELGESGRSWVARTHGTEDRQARVRRALAPVWDSQEDDDA